MPASKTPVYSKINEDGNPIIGVASMKTLKDEGLLHVHKDGRTAVIDNAVLAERIAKVLHSSAFVVDNTGLAEDGVTIASLGDQICKTSGMDVDARLEVEKIIGGVLGTGPTAKVQKALGSLDPSGWLIKADIEREVIEVGSGVSNFVRLPVYACTSAVKMIKEHDVTKRSATLRRAAANRRKTDTALIERVPEAVVEVLAAAQFTAEMAVVEARATFDEATAAMTSAQRAEIEAKVATTMTNLREIEATAAAAATAPALASA